MKPKTPETSLKFSCSRENQHLFNLHFLIQGHNLPQTYHTRTHNGTRHQMFEVSQLYNYPPELSLGNHSQGSYRKVQGNLEKRRNCRSRSNK